VTSSPTHPVALARLLPAQGACLVGAVLLHHTGRPQSKTPTGLHHTYLRTHMRQVVDLHLRVLGLQASLGLQVSQVQCRAATPRRHTSLQLPACLRPLPAVCLPRALDCLTRQAPSRPLQPTLLHRWTPTAAFQERPQRNTQLLAFRLMSLRRSHISSCQLWAFRLRLPPSRPPALQCRHLQYSSPLRPHPELPDLWPTSRLIWRPRCLLLHICP
jgi:hypothetical protein